MRIEVATVRTATTKEKGDLLEELAAELLRTQGYSVETEVRRTGSELDLLCTHDINGRRIYVECKAERDPLSANVLKNLMGAVTLYDYSEGWLISAGPLGKEAKGIQVEWEERPQHEREKLSIYTPERVVTALVTARVSPPSRGLRRPRRKCHLILEFLSEIGHYLSRSMGNSGRRQYSRRALQRRFGCSSQGEARPCRIRSSCSA